jgi:hypothetical protein
MHGRLNFDSRLCRLSRVVVAIDDEKLLDRVISVHVSFRVLQSPPPVVAHTCHVTESFVAYLSEVSCVRLDSLMTSPCCDPVPPRRR